MPILKRKCEESYQVPGTNLILPKGLTVTIPVLGIHHDPEIYPEPEKFDPERFTKEGIAARHPYAWLPFGKGPRDCIGLRFGMMQTRIGLATVLNNYRIETSKNTPIPLIIQKSGIILSPDGGMFLRLEKL